MTDSRHDGRQPDELRPVTLTRNYIASAAGSVLIEAGRTRVICTACVENDVPVFLKGAGSGWVTAEYGMLPGSTGERKRRAERTGRIDGRTLEIQRLIGRSLRAAMNLRALGPRTVYIDCDVIEADGGTRTLSITGAYIALADALARLVADRQIARVPLLTEVAAVSVGILRERPLLDLNYPEDLEAEVDMNVVMTGRGEFVEIQGTAEKAAFNDDELQAMLSLARGGIKSLLALQAAALSESSPCPDES